MKQLARRKALTCTGILTFCVFSACGGSSIEPPPGESGGGPSSGGAGGGGVTTGGVGGSWIPSGGAGGAPHHPGGGSGPGGAGGNPYWTCFAAGTSIATPAGEVAIEKLHVGDAVLAYDAAEHRIVARPVTALFVHPGAHPGTLDTGNGRVLRVTGEHPVYLADEDRYVEAKDLDGNERLLALDARGGTRSTIGGALRPGDGALAETVYNITVDGTHNYFAEGVLVHNKGSGGRPACLPPSANLDYCAPSGECLNPLNPTSERVSVNQRVRNSLPDGGIPSEDAGGADDGGLTQAGRQFSPSASAWICPAGAATPDTFHYLAFDVWTPDTSAQVNLFIGEEACSGRSAGEVWLWDYEPPPAGVWTTQCVRFATAELSQGSLSLSTSPGAAVENPRLVTHCDCPRVRKVRTTCGVTDPTGAGGGSSCLLTLD